MTFLDFQTKLATQNRVQSSKRKVAEHRATFERAEKEFGVPASVITGFWALESDFGAGMGKLPILPSLVALAYDCRRGEMFTEELIAALQIMDRGDMSPSGMIGSWAGEIGQTQFLPTRYLDYAIDYDGDGRINLFSNDDDVIGSTANYMKNLGWRSERAVDRGSARDQGSAVGQGRSRHQAAAHAMGRMGHSVSRWQRRTGGRHDRVAAAAHGAQRAGVPRLPEFRYLHGVEQLAELRDDRRLSGDAHRWRRAMSRGRGDTNGLDAAGTKELQQILAGRGYDVGKIDGLAGAKTRAAVKDMQIKLGMPADSLRDAGAAWRAASRRLMPSRSDRCAGIQRMLAEDTQGVFDTLCAESRIASASYAPASGMTARGHQCSLTTGSVRRVSMRDRVSRITLPGPCSAISCIL